jgi:signal transduction histidine kinase
VEVVDDGDHVVLRVSDDGPGVPAGDAESIFLPFVTSRPRPESTGLGLPGAREIAAAHRGTLELESVAAGASFRLRVPKAPS